MEVKAGFMGRYLPRRYAAGEVGSFVHPEHAAQEGPSRIQEWLSQQHPTPTETPAPAAAAQTPAPTWGTWAKENLPGVAESMVPGGILRQSTVPELAGTAAMAAGGVAALGAAAKGTALAARAAAATGPNGLPTAARGLQHASGWLARAAGGTGSVSAVTNAAKTVGSQLANAGRAAFGAVKAVPGVARAVAALAPEAANVAPVVLPAVAQGVAGKVLPGAGAALSVGSNMYKAVSGDQNYRSDSALGQYGEQALRTTGDLVGGTMAGPWGVAAAGAGVATNLASNSVGALRDRATAGRDIAAARGRADDITASLSPGAKAWLQSQQVAGATPEDQAARRAWGAGRYQQLTKARDSGAIDQKKFEGAQGNLGTVLSRFNPSGTQPPDFSQADKDTTDLFKGIQHAPMTPPAVNRQVGGGLAPGETKVTQ